MNFNVSVVLPAGGIGERMGIEVPKQYCNIHNFPVWHWTVQLFERLSWIDRIVLCVNPREVLTVQSEVHHYGHHKTSVVEAGATRHRSIKNGVLHISTVNPECEIVIIHDVVRPFVNEDIIQIIATYAKEYGAAGVTCPLVSTVVAINPNSPGFLDKSLTRAEYRNSEMPQAFRLETIMSAYQQCTDYDLDYGTECLHLAKMYAKVPVKLVDTTEPLWKITYKKDLFAAEALIKASQVVSIVDCPPRFKGLLKTHCNKFQEVYFLQSNNELKLRSSSAILFHHSYNAIDIREKTIDIAGTIHENMQSFSPCGAVLHVILTEDTAATGLREILWKFAEDFRQKRICINALVFRKDSEETMLSDIASSIVFDCKLAFSGQVYFI